jgi:hypothetical protein
VHSDIDIIFLQLSWFNLFIPKSYQKLELFPNLGNEVSKVLIHDLLERLIPLKK